MPKVDINAPTAVYRLYDTGDVLLYVGVAVDPAARWAWHADEKTWWPQVVRREVEWHPNRPDAEAAEVAAIVTEHPRHNVEHSTTRQRGDALGEYRSKYAPARQVRVTAKMWRDFGRATRAAGTSRGAALVAFMNWYMRRPGAKLPERPAAGSWSKVNAD